MAGLVWMGPRHVLCLVGRLCVHRAVQLVSLLRFCRLSLVLEERRVLRGLWSGGPRICGLCRWLSVACHRLCST